MKFDKVVFIRYFPLTEAIYTDLYFNELIKENIKVEYLDISILFNLQNTAIINFNFDGTIKISSYRQLEDYFEQQNNNSTLYISIMTFEWRVLKLFRLFTKHKLKLGVFARGVFPTSSEDSKSRIFRLFKSVSFKRINAFLVNKIAILSKKSGYVNAYDYIFKAGEFGFWGLGTGCEIDYAKAKIIEVNTVDYDKFVIHREKVSTNKEAFIVFLDQYLPYHPDVDFLKITTVQPEPYFKEINSYFDRIEKLTGLKVIIAAHPKAERYKKNNPFDGRQIFFNQSNDLVKDASIVLTHASTAICFPICYEKKIGLLMSDYIDEMLPHFKILARAIVNACDAKFISIDDQEHNLFPDTINKEKYIDFKYKYLTSVVSENTTSREIFLEFLNRPI